MTSARKEFLSALFESLDRKAVPYCLLRNYQNLYEDTASDVDMLVEPESLPRAEDCLAEAAAASGHQLVQRARHITFFNAYWHSAGGFIRIDLQREVRWRIFPVLTARAVLGARRKQGAFYIPDPRHESVILFVAALWRGQLSDRYHQQLARLYQELAGAAALPETFRAAFGAIGQELASCQANILNQTFPSGLWQRARCSVIRNAFRGAPNRRALVHYLAQDIARAWGRLSRPPGLSLLYASSAERARKWDGFLERIKLLYPTEKVALHSFQLSTKPPAPIPRLGIRRRLQRLRTLFKGGLFLRSCLVANDSQLQKVLRTHARFLYPSRAFVCSEDSRLQTCLGHVRSGFMADLSPLEGTAVPDDRLIQFIAAMLGREQRRSQRVRGTRGAFVVLVGLDGSGKTTVARQLCCLGVEQERFDRFRYFHWQPAIIGGARFPLPEYKNVPHKPELSRNLFRSVLSAARLFKNLFLANLAYRVRVRPLLRRNALVLVDRYLYNYLLDPVSVKYYGPAWLLERVQRLFPRPELVVVLKAPVEVLRARKQELSPHELLRQSAVLEQLRFNAGATLAVDASRPAEETAREILRELALTSSPPPANENKPGDQNADSPLRGAR